jgi:hypothetical protein
MIRVGLAVVGVDDEAQAADFLLGDAVEAPWSDSR